MPEVTQDKVRAADPTAAAKRAAARVRRAVTALNEALEQARVNRLEVDVEVLGEDAGEEARGTQFRAVAALMVTSVKGEVVL